VSRRLKQVYNCKPLDELTRQLLFSPPDKRARQVIRVERLHDQIESEKNYPLDFLFYRITKYRREGKDAVVLAGEAVLPDLRLMIDTLSRSIRMPMEDKSGPVETVQQLADRLGVSTKTIGRWRGSGMRWRWVALAGGGRKVVAVPRAASERYIGDHPDQVRRAAAFTQMEPAARKRLIERARQIARRREVSLNQVAAHLAQKTGRALQTIRQVLVNYDRDHPNRAIFTDHVGPLAAKQKRVIVRAYRVGVPVDRIAERFKRTRSTVYRVVHQHRAGGAVRVSLEYIASPIFDREDADEVILGRSLEELTRSTGMSKGALDDLPEAMRGLFVQPRIPADRVRALFVRYNYVKFRAGRARGEFDRYSPGAKQVAVFDDLVGQARVLRDLLVRIHLPVVLSVARRHLIGKTGSTRAHLIELMEQGLGVLIQSVETFNHVRQRRFDSALTNRLLARFATESKPGGGSGAKQAQRKLQDGDGLKRLTDLAGEAGVELGNGGWEISDGGLE
jgi:Homeodomain-like domain